MITTPLQTPAQHPPARCSGDCGGGTRDCTCAHAVIGMWDEERANPWRVAAVYAAVIVGAMLASHFFPWGVAA